MKRLVFKKWVNLLNLIVMVLAIMSLVGETENIILFIVSKAIVGIILIVLLYLQIKYGRREVL